MRRTSRVSRVITPLRVIVPPQSDWTIHTIRNSRLVAIQRLTVEESCTVVVVWVEAVFGAQALRSLHVCGGTGEGGVDRSCLGVGED